jgi:hypothetical protein
MGMDDSGVTSASLRDALSVQSIDAMNAMALVAIAEAAS